MQTSRLVLLTCNSISLDVTSCSPSMGRGSNWKTVYKWINAELFLKCFWCDMFTANMPCYYTKTPRVTYYLSIYMCLQQESIKDWFVFFYEFESCFHYVHFKAIPVEVEIWICHNLFSGLCSHIVADMGLNYYLLQFTFLFIVFWAHKENALFARRQPFLLWIMKLSFLYSCSFQKAHGKDTSYYDPVINFMIQTTTFLYPCALQSS